MQLQIRKTSWSFNNVKLYRGGGGGGGGGGDGMGNVHKVTRVFCATS